MKGTNSVSGSDSGKPQTSGKTSGKGLKPGLNMADTGSVVNQVTGTVRFGRQKVSGNVSGRNSMVSANATMKSRR